MKPQHDSSLIPKYSTRSLSSLETHGLINSALMEYFEAKRHKLTIFIELHFSRIERWHENTRFNTTSKCSIISSCLKTQIDSTQTNLVTRLNLDIISLDSNDVRHMCRILFNSNMTECMPYKPNVHSVYPGQCINTRYKGMWCQPVRVLPTQK